MNAAASKTNSDVTRLILYVAGDSPRSLRARSNLQRELEQSQFQDMPLKEIDVLEHPGEIIERGIFATPALSCDTPAERTDILYGDLSNKARLQDFLQDVLG